MSTNTWTQYVSMDEANPDRLLQAALENFDDWDDDFEIGDEGLSLDLDDLDEPE